MELLLERKYLKAAYTIGCLSIDGTRFCDTLEDRVRDLSRGMKVAGATAIPAGRYQVVVNHSPRFGRELPRLLKVRRLQSVAQVAVSTLYPVTARLWDSVISPDPPEIPETVRRLYYVRLGGI